MKTFKLAILAGLTAPIMILCGCETVSITTDYDPSVSFANFRTYALEPPPQVPPLSISADAALRSTLQETLAARGIREVAPTENPDLAVVTHLSLQQRYSVHQFTAWGYGPGVWPYRGGRYRVWVGAPITHTSITSYTDGTLILDFVDISRQTLVFRGTGRATVSRDPQRNAENIRDAVRRIVARLPQ